MKQVDTIAYWVSYMRSIEGTAAVADFQQEFTLGEKACETVDPDIMFPDADAQTSPLIKQAAKVCGECAVSKACTISAIYRKEEHGVWGGQGPRLRRAIVRELYPKTKKPKEEAA